ncbi:MAG TPA: RidA family protein [Acidimicrobiales bacterium]|nr:RidA family protein [Acidimicrobiales bacterium]
MPVELIRQPASMGQPLGKYSQLSIARGTEIVAIAGQVGVTPDGRIPGDGSVTAQTRQAFFNVRAALEAAGLGLHDLFKMTTYLVGADNLPEFMEARSVLFTELFPDENYPPNTLLIVSRLVEERFQIEVEGLAVRGRP